jgi:hypothetical protein
MGWTAGLQRPLARSVRCTVNEKLAYWYFRLNGFMTMESFILHDESRKGLPQRTDADIYGVRFPFSLLATTEKTKVSGLVRDLARNCEKIGPRVGSRRRTWVLSSLTPVIR